VIVGEQGPELLTLPQAATVQPLGFASASGGGQPQRFEINLNVGQRQLESVILDIINGRIATA
jgi:hypothetical protein